MVQQFQTADRLSKDDKQRVVYVDIDETISRYEGERRYDLALPIPENIDKINKLYDAGWRVMYWTARGSVSEIDYFYFTCKQLESWGCKFHGLICGPEKGHFDMVIDDKAKRIEELPPANKIDGCEEMAQFFHETYERLAPDFDYKTRDSSAVEWENVPENNKKLMIAVCSEVLRVQRQVVEDAL